MSKLFLLNKTTSHHMGMAETFCFLFPAELLFEGFIGGFIREHFKNKVKITTQARDIYLTELTVNGEIIGNRFLLKEDIVIQNGDSILILDTKYKEIERLSRARTEDGKLGITDADMKQMAVYASRRGAERLYLLYPLYRGAKPDTTEVIFHIIIGNGSAQRKIPLQILQVPFALGEDPEEAKRLLLRTLSDAVRVDGPPVSSFRRNFEKTLPSEFQYGIINHA